jgi:Rieske Fe-S protein
MERKEFLLSLGLGAGSLIASCCLGGCSKSDNNGGTTPNPPPGTGNKVDFSFDTTSDTNLSSRGWTTRNNVIIARNGNAYLAFEAACPHQGSSLTYDSAVNTFPCSNTGPGHGSVFDANGRRVAGPAARDLKKYQTQLTGNTLRVFE